MLGHAILYMMLHQSRHACFLRKWTYPTYDHLSDSKVDLFQKMTVLSKLIWNHYFQNWIAFIQIFHFLETSNQLTPNRTG